MSELTEEGMQEIIADYEDLTNMFDGLSMGELLKFIKLTQKEMGEISPILAFSLGRSIGRKEVMDGRVRIS